MLENASIALIAATIADGLALFVAAVLLFARSRTPGRAIAA
jgi:hypothetical protein